MLWSILVLYDIKHCVKRGSNTIFVSRRNVWLRLLSTTRHLHVLFPVVRERIRNAFCAGQYWNQLRVANHSIACCMWYHDQIGLDNDHDGAMTRSEAISGTRCYDWVWKRLQQIWLAVISTTNLIGYSTTNLIGCNQYNTSDWLQYNRSDWLQGDGATESSTMTMTW